MTFTVLDVTKWFGETSGGVKTYLTEKSAYVRRNPGLRHVLAIPGATDEVIDDAGGRVRTYRLRGPQIPTQTQYRFLLATRSLRRIVEHEQPDVIEVGSQMFVPWVTRLATRRRRTPLVGFYHGNVERNVGAEPQVDDSRHSLLRRATRAYLRAVDRLFAARFAASDALASDLRAAGIRDVTRVRLGVDTETFHPRRRAQRDATRRARGLPTGDPIVLYCGRIAGEKDVAWLVRSWRLMPSVSRAWLVVVGDGPLKSALQAEVRAARARILWLPFESDRGRLADLLACADLVVSPGPIETFGLSALEAMACGTPVASVDRGAGAELVRNSGAGVTWRLRDDGDFAATLALFLRGEVERFGAKGRAYAEREHVWDKAFRELFTSYQTLVEKNR